MCFVLIKLFCFSFFVGFTRVKCKKCDISSLNTIHPRIQTVKLCEDAETSLNELFDSVMVEAFCREGFTNAKAKSLKVMQFPELLVLHITRLDGNSLEKSKAEVEVQSEIIWGDCEYELVGLVMHHGERMRCGNYTAVARRETSGGFEWNEFDDSLVTIRMPRIFFVLQHDIQRIRHNLFLPKIFHENAVLCAFADCNHMLSLLN